MDWAKIAKNDYALPEGINPLESLDELLGMLGDPNPVVRDEQGYGTLANWIRAGHFDARLQELGDQCVANLQDPNVLLRSFSVLILAEVVRCNRKHSLLPRHAVQPWLERWQQWYPNEPDVRSYEDGTGWIHAVAHGADFAFEWALSEDESAPLRLLMASFTERFKHLPLYLSQTENDRVALAILAVLSRPAFRPNDIQDWLSSYQTLWTVLEPGKIPPGAVLAVQTLQSLYVLLKLGATDDGAALKPAYPQETLEEVEAALKTVYPFYGTPDASP